MLTLVALAGALCYVPSHRSAAMLKSRSASVNMIASAELDGRERRRWMSLLESFAGEGLAADLWPGASLSISLLMTPAASLVTLSPDMCLKQAATTLVEAGITGAPVVDDGRLVGVISQTDLLYKLAGSNSLMLRGQGPRSLRYADNTRRMAKIKGETVRCSMSRSPRSIAPTQSIKEAAGEMLRNKHNRLMVTEKGILVGILSSSDIIRVALCVDDECEMI